MPCDCCARPESAPAAARLPATRAAALVPWCALPLILLPQLPLRAAGYAVLAVWTLRDWRWGFRLILATLPFTALGTFELFFTLKPFQVLAVILAAALLRAAGRGMLPPRRRTPLDPLLAAFVAIMLVSLVNTGQWTTSLLLLVNYTSLVVLALLFSGWYPAGELVRVPHWLVFGAVGMAPVQIVSLFTEQFTRKLLPVSAAAGASATGDYLIFVIPFLFLLLRPGRLARWGLALLLGCLLFDLTITYNRGSWAAAAFLAVYAVLRLRGRVLVAGKLLLAVSAVWLALFTAALAWLSYFPVADANVLRRFNPLYVASGGMHATRPDELAERRASSEHWRLYVWKQVAEQFIIPHWLIGSGVGNIGLPLHNPPAHNNGMQVAGETGVLGLALLVAMYLTVYRGLWRSWRASAGRDRFALAAMAALAALIVHGYNANTLVFAQHWLLLALGIVHAGVTAPPGRP